MSGIIVGVDGSYHSERALEWAVNEAAIRHAPLTVVTVHEAVLGSWGGTTSYPQDHARAEQARQAVHEATEKALARLGESRPASVAIQPVAGTPGEGLLTVAEGADMIVLGSRSASGPVRLLGSVTTHVLHHAHCPVVIIPPDSR
jgi:nucleotide-binding universal stress UspA family protein